MDFGQRSPSQFTEAERLGAMGNRMRHTGKEVVQTWAPSGSRLVIARVGLSHLMVHPWPASKTDTAPGSVVFVDGVLHGDRAESARAPRAPAVESSPNSACEFVARAGATGLPALTGHFTLAIWDPSNERLVIAVDRRASRPLVYATVGNTLYFAPEGKALLAVAGIDKALNDEAVGVFLGAGYVLGHQTLFRSIHRLCPGEAITVKPGSVTRTLYSEYALSEDGDGRSATELEEDLAHRVEAAVSKNFRDAERTVVFLSGGVDSRAIAAVASRIAAKSGHPLSTITWAAPDPRTDSDLDIARRVARAIGSRHREVVRRTSGYGAAFAETNYLLEGLTDVAAYHPHEFSIMADLAAGGVTTVERGDECFGWGPRVLSLEEALVSLNFRPLEHLRGVGRVVEQRSYERLCEASRAALDEATAPFTGVPPNDAKDLLYFRHRLPGYLGSAAYLKQVVLDHRTPLTDESILEFNACVPGSLRANKEIFVRAALRIAPELRSIPYASSDNLEDWGRLLASSSPVRRYVELELRDSQSAIWEWFDRRALLEGLPELGRPSATLPLAVVERSAKQFARRVLSVAPPVERSLRLRSRRAGIRFDQICLRVLVLKNFVDVFVSGDGSRDAYERCLGEGASDSERAA